MSNTWLKKLENINHGKFSQLIRISLVIILVFLLIGSFRLYKDIWPTAYVAKQEGFKIVFNQVPSVNKLTDQKVAAGEETGEIYSVENQDKGTDYAVYVTNYPDANFGSFSKSSQISILNSQIETLAKNEQADLSNGQAITFEGLVAVRATLTPTNQSEQSSELLAFLNKNRSYIIFGTGINQSKFNSFTKTFHFVN